jgi:hypothetical protein
MSKWMICPNRNKLCQSDCKHAKRHLHESDCDYLIVCPIRKPTFMWHTLGKCEPTTAPIKGSK